MSDDMVVRFGKFDAGWSNASAQMLLAAELRATYALEREDGETFDEWAKRRGIDDLAVGGNEG